MTPKGGKPTDHDHNLISSEGAQDTSTCKISDHSLHAFSGKCPETSPDGRTDRRTDGRTCGKTVTVGRMDQRTHVQVRRGYFRLRTDGRTDIRTDGQPENIMPPAPKGGGITKRIKNKQKQYKKSSENYSPPSQTYRSNVFKTLFLKYHLDKCIFVRLIFCPVFGQHCYCCHTSRQKWRNNPVYSYQPWNMHEYSIDLKCTANVKAWLHSKERLLLKFPRRTLLVALTRDMGFCSEDLCCDI